MIIYKDYTWMVSSSYEPADFQHEDIAYILDDESQADLCQKVMMFAPNIKIITNDEDEATDIIQYFPLDTLIEQKKEELNQKCTDTIVAGIDVNGEHYDLTNEDQINLLALSRDAENGNDIVYHSSGNACRVYSSDEFLSVFRQLNRYIQSNLLLCNLLKSQLSDLDEERLQDTDFSAEHLNESNKKLYYDSLNKEA